MTRIQSLATAACATALVATALPAAPAHAALGHAYDSVAADRAHLSARMSSARRSTHIVHTLTLASGGTVREFEGPDGQVFAVAWRGAGRPDLRQLLGERFATLQADNVRSRARRPRAPLSVSRGDFVVRTGGHPGAVWGLAYLPGHIPAGFTGKDFADTP